MRTIFVLGVLAASLSTSAAAQGADGKALYDQHCKKCHGATGKPSEVMKKKFDKMEAFDAAFFAKRSDADVIKAIDKGTKDQKMKGFADKMKADEMAAVAKYMRTLKP